MARTNCVSLEKVDVIRRSTSEGGFSDGFGGSPEIKNSI
jgi:hypothetical protein